jgi:hypothetical protein
MANVTLQEAVQNYANALAEKVNTFVADVAVLEVRTYTTPADQVETFVKGQADFAEILTEGKAALRALTRVAFDGDTTAWVPTEAGGQVDKSLKDIHEATVAQAMANRAAMLESVGRGAAAALAALQKSKE